MDNLQIIRANKDDLSQILKIKAQSHEKYVECRPDLYKSSMILYTQEFILPFFENENKYILIAKLDNDIAGYMFAEIVRVEMPMMVFRKYMYIHDLAVLDTFRRHGIASRLFSYAEKIAATFGAEKIELAVHLFSEHAITLYEKIGFTPRAIRMEKTIKKEMYNMKKISIYEEALCCPTGLCGVSIDSELLRISTVINTLKKKGIEVDRFNLSNSPMEFVTNPIVNKLINEKGVDELPYTLVDDAVVVTGRYPTNQEIAGFLDISVEDLNEEQKMNNLKSLI